MLKFKSISWKLWRTFIRHWILTGVEIILPICIFILLAYCRSNSPSLKKGYVSEPTYYDHSNIYDIYSQMDVGKINLWYTPSNSFTKDIISRVQEKLNIQGDVVRQFHNKADLDRAFKRSKLETIAVVVFKGNKRTTLDYDLSISEKYLSWKTNKLFRPINEAEDEERESLYFSKGHVSLQAALDISFIESSSNITNIKISLQEFPNPPRVVDNANNIIFNKCLPLVTIIGFIFLITQVLKGVSEEKRFGTKEFLKILGLSSLSNWLGWLIRALTTTLISLIGIIVIMKINVFGDPLIEHSDGTVLFMFLFLYCMATISCSFLITTIFSTPSITILIGVITWLFSYFIPHTFMTRHDSLPWLVKLICSFIPNIALGEGYSSIAIYEIRGIGIQWNNIHLPASGGSDEITMCQIFLILASDVIFYMTLTLYIENINPGPFGMAKPFTFPLKQIKKIISKITSGRRLQMNLRDEMGNMLPIVENGETGHTLKIVYLTKKYGTVAAVDGLNIDIEPNCITVLLGQNGAGKTTTMNILIGMINATSGHVIINGYDIKDNAEECRKHVGVCPQHNLLFPDLTVKEHIEFIVKIKGIKISKQEIHELLKSLEIYEERKKLPECLSGGMKRKLCLAMALVGNPKILILDEPTAGMDMEARRKVWSILEEKRKDTTILLSTHFMEEAEKYGDRILIMKHGEIQEDGTILYLKNKYSEERCISIALETQEHVQNIYKTVKGYFPEVDNSSLNNINTLFYEIKIEKDNNNLIKLLQQLEDNKTTFKISSVHIKEKPLSDVFLKISNPTPAKDLETASEKNIKTKKSYSVLVSTLKRRMYFFMRTYPTFILAGSLGMLLISIAIWLAIGTAESSGTAGRSLNLDLDVYQNPVIYTNNVMKDGNLQKIHNTFKQLVEKYDRKVINQVDVNKASVDSGKENIAFYKKYLISAVEFTTSVGELSINGLYSSSALHSVPITLNLITNTIIKTINNNFAIETSITELESRFNERIVQELQTFDVIALWLMLIPLGLMFLISYCMFFPNAEIPTGFFKIQKFFGVGNLTYVISNFIFDSMLIAGQLIVLLVILMGFQYFTNCFAYNDIETIILFLLPHLISSLPFVYLIAHNRSFSGFAILVAVGFIFGIVPAGVFQFFEDKITGTEWTYFQKFLNVISPYFSLSSFCVKFSTKFVENFNWRFMSPLKRSHICEVEPNPCCNDDSKSLCDAYQQYFSQEELIILAFSMLGSCMIYFAIVVFLNTRFSKLCKCCANRVRDAADSVSKCALKVKQLTKKMGKKFILNDINLSLKSKSCLGLLGKNGAGKSTTFNILSQCNSYDEGKITLRDGTEISTSEYAERIGYCPQKDSLNYHLTGREIIRNMLECKGYMGKSLENLTKDFLNNFDLKDYGDRPCSQYSGGNQRKLSTCLAFLDNPEVIFLDEPTAGVDIGSQKKIWDMILDIKNNEEKDTSFVISSHSMEECERLCDEVAILNKGKIAKTGHILDLKPDHGFEYTIEISMNYLKEEKILEDLLQKHLKVEFSKKYKNLVTFKLTQTDQKLSDIYQILDNLRTKHSFIDDFRVITVSLENVIFTTEK